MGLHASRRSGPDSAVRASSGCAARVRPGGGGRSPEPPVTATPTTAATAVPAVSAAVDNGRAATVWALTLEFLWRRLGAVDTP